MPGQAHGKQNGNPVSAKILNVLLTACAALLAALVSSAWDISREMGEISAASRSWGKNLATMQVQVETLETMITEGQLPVADARLTALESNMGSLLRQHEIGNPHTYRIQPRPESAGP